MIPQLYHVPTTSMLLMLLLLLNNTPTIHAAMVKVCHKGETKTVQDFKLDDWIRVGATRGACTGASSPNTRMDTLKICHKGMTKTIQASRWDLWERVGATKGACSTRTADTRLGAIDPRSHTNLNDNRLISASVRNEPTSEVVFYGTKNVNNTVRSVNAILLNKPTNVFTYEFGSENRITRAQSAVDEFSMDFAWFNDGQGVYLKMQVGDNFYDATFSDFNQQVFGTNNRLLRSNGQVDEEELEALEEDGQPQDDESGESHTLRGVEEEHRQLQFESVRKVVLNLETCGDRYSDATLQMPFTTRDAAGNILEQSTALALRKGNGQYEFTIPVAENTRFGGDDPGKSACKKIVNAVQPACNTFVRSIRLRFQDNREQFCRAVRQKLKLGQGSTLGIDFEEKCQNTMLNAWKACSVTRAENGNQLPDTADVFCKDYGSNRRLQTTRAVRWDLQPGVIFPFEYQRAALPRAGGSTIPTVREVVQYTYDLDDGPAIVAMRTNPINPRSGQQYFFYVDMRCIDQDNKIKLYVQGGDGYLASQTFSGSDLPDSRSGTTTTVSIKVPGATKVDTKDTLTATITGGGDSITKTMTVIF